jgi:D-alanine transaminase/branched-chain amino acid aminotransferase
MNYYCYANARPHDAVGRGKILRKNDIKVGIGDLVMLRGYGVFDYMRTYYGVPFRVNDYLSRFEQSAKGMKLKLPLKRKQIISVINSLLKKNKARTNPKSRKLTAPFRVGGKDFGIRLLLTGGYSLDSYLPSVKPNLFILIEDLPQYPAWYSTKGIKLMLCEHKREMSRIKTINYLTAIHLADERRKHKAQDTLYCHEGKILETTRNNFFLFQGNTLVTSGDDVLQGITRKVVLELARGKFKVEVRDVLKEEINRCTECFVTGTTRGVTPVVQIDKTKIGNGKAGKNTKELIKMFEEKVAEECKRH